MTAYLSSDTTIAEEHSKFIESQLAANIPLKQDLIYHAVTDNATPREIFLHNVPNSRIAIPKQTVIHGRWQGVSVNVTDDAAGVAVEGTFSAYRNAAGAAAVVNAATGTGFVFTVNAGGWMVCTVTGTAAKQILWRCRVHLVGLSPATAMLRDGIYTGVPS